MAFRSDVWLCRQTIPQCCGIFSIVCVFPIINNLLPRTLPFVPIYWAVTLDSGLMRFVFEVLSCVTTGPSVWYAWGPAHVAQSSRAFLSPPVHTSNLPFSLTQSCLNCCASSLGWEATSCKGARIGNQMKTRVWWSIGGVMTYNPQSAATTNQYVFTWPKHLTKNRVKINLTLPPSDGQSTCSGTNIDRSCVQPGSENTMCPVYSQSPGQWCGLPTMNPLNFTVTRCVCSICIYKISAEQAKIVYLWHIYLWYKNSTRSVSVHILGHLFSV